ncbi:MAG: DUF3147 family protein, partial [Bdellovibrionales bacterium]|nr:DUF3147 family protein [Bdellovibrionales bacterium]
MTGLPLEILLSFIVGALCVSTLTVTADRFGSTTGGILGGFPASVAAALFFLGRAEGVDASMRAATVVPMSISFVAVLLLVYCWLIPCGLTVAIIVGLLAWTALAAAVVVLGEPGLIGSVCVFVGVALCVRAGFSRLH